MKIVCVCAQVSVTEATQDDKDRTGREEEIKLCMACVLSGKTAATPRRDTHKAIKRH